MIRQLPRTNFFDSVLQQPYAALAAGKMATQYLSGKFTLDGKRINGTSTLELDQLELKSSEFAQLLMIFDGARVHEQVEYQRGRDDAPAGVYFTSTQPHLIQHPHKNRIGIYEEEETRNSLYLQALHIDHLFLHNQAPEWLGTIGFALSAMTAHRMDYRRVTVIAGGGIGYLPRLIGYKFWPKLGFDALLSEEERADIQLPAGATVQDALAQDSAWWEKYGSQRFMEFDLTAHSRSWGKLLHYLNEKELI